MKHRQIIRLFGGIRPMAKALRVKNPSTVQYWKAAGTIPPRWWPAILKAALRGGMKLKNTDFLNF